MDDKILREHLQRLLHCLTEGTAIGQDVVKALCNRASRPLTYKEEKNRRTVLFAACAVLRKYLNDQAQKEEWTMILDENNTDRSYLFGRLLALMEYVERRTYDRGEEREPNAIRMQTVFCERPMDTAKNLTARLEPYYRKLSPISRAWCRDQIGGIYGLFRQEDLPDMNRPLESTYLLGYNLQRNVLYQKKTSQTEPEEE